MYFKILIYFKNIVSFSSNMAMKIEITHMPCVLLDRLAMDYLDFHYII